MAPTRTGSKRLLRDLNQSIVFNLIAEQPAISRTELAKKSGLPAATITHIVSSFLNAGLISEVASEETSIGRRPILLNINASAGFVIGVKLREDGMTVTACDLSCTPVYTSEFPLQTNDEPHHVVEAISLAVKQLIANANISMQKVLGVGIGLSGLIDSTQGLCRYSSILNWQNVEIGPALSFKLHLPVRVDNDVNTLAVAEHLFGVGQNVSNFLLTTIGRGIGAGIVVDNEIYRGAHGGAGEFGHMTIDTSPDAPLCNCGKRGCLEAIASDYGIVRAATGIDPGHHVEDAIGELITRAKQGDRAIQIIFDNAGKALGIAMANLINIFDPTHILIGGEGLQAGDLILGPLRATIPQYVFGPRQDVDLIIRPIDETHWARGAASLILHEVFQAPIYEDAESLVIDDLLSQVAHTQRKRKKQ
jgi:Transcriptional regulator/sugar kinase